ncbi:MAG: alpha/beta fold hydrolase [Jatrophihabitantaceae bacterium]
MLRPAAGIPVAEIVLFPHAGAYPGTYHQLAAWLPGTVSVRVVTPRATCAGVAEIAEALGAHSEALADVRPQARPRLPRLFAGHSLGGLLAWQVTAALDGAALPDILVLSAALPPEVTRDRLRRSSLLDDLGLLRHLRDTGSLDGAAADNDKLRDYYLKAYREDVRLALDRFPLSASPVGVPVLTMCGTADPVASCAEVRRWEQHTTGPVEHVCVPGGHDYFYTAPQVATVLSQALAGARRPTP